jgi:hypothetical protein
VTRCDLLAPYRNFSYFCKMFLTLILLHEGTGYGFFPSTAAFDHRINTYHSDYHTIHSPDKEIMDQKQDL